VDKAVKRAVEIVGEIVETGGPMGLQESVIIAKDIFRKFPGKFEGLIKNLCKKIDEITEPDSKAAMIWIIGEFAEKIDGAEKLIEEFSKSLTEEPYNVQLQLLTATVKLYLKKPDEGEELIENVLKVATTESNNPDLMDRAYIYWRMLSADPEKTKQVVLSEKPHISEDSYNTYDDDFVERLIEQISTLSSVYHKTPEAMQAAIKKLQSAKKEEAKATEPA